VKPVVDPAEVTFVPIRAQGPGGQNVNKVSSAVQLRFDIAASTLPEPVKARLAAMPDHRIGSDGVIVIKAQTHRSATLNRTDALARLQALVDAAATVPRHRVATRPTRGSVRRRLEAKSRQSDRKASRRSPVD